ncbi:hypothetical protein DLAC_00774 [Tieghemostelium lacteum]|uniref:Uncharacterized protein n=1 Tax=Tieghemostelium lacteum TaxID=361077 RepID=A0A152A6Y5_TIELA|nr:hypothetical protein DLAC_00774 [Tieghemostelium lacteum]|eukprot:KYR01980.1 hypothetical protein DLAC_00774 [Tieghemostelium lacteum]
MSLLSPFGTHNNQSFGNFSFINKLQGKDLSSVYQNKENKENIDDNAQLEENGKVFQSPKRNPLTPVKNIMSPSSEDEKTTTLRVITRSPNKSPNIKNKNSVSKSKRFKSLVNNLPSIKSMDDVVKLQEEITEYKDKISGFQNQVQELERQHIQSTEEKVKLELQIEELNKDIVYWKSKTTALENHCKSKEEELNLVKDEHQLELTELEKKYEYKLNLVTVEKTISDQLNHKEIFSLKDQLNTNAMELSKTQEQVKVIEQTISEITVKSDTIEQELKLQNQLNLDLTHSLESTNELLINVKKDYFMNTCLAIKLSMPHSPTLLCQDLFELAESLSISPGTYQKWIAQKLNEFADANKNTNFTTTTNDTNTNNTSKNNNPSSNNKKSNKNKK